MINMLPPGLDDMLRQHYGRCSDLVETLDADVIRRDWSQCVNHAVALNELLTRHIRFEEEQIFPVILDGAAAQDRHGAEVARMRSEHAGVSNLATLLVVSSPAHDPQGWLDILAQLRAQLVQHMEDEASLLGRSAALSAEVIEQLRRRSASLAPVERKGRFIDVSGLEPPAPMFRILEELPRADTPLTVRIHREPLPLYGMLQEGGYAYSTVATDDGHFEILIWRAEKSQAGESGKA